jgi:hypothetical protein
MLDRPAFCQSPPSPDHCSTVEWGATCAWCQKAIYYDRKMPSPPDITRVCIPCGLLLLEAQKKGAN